MKSFLENLFATTLCITFFYCIAGFTFENFTNIGTRMVIALLIAVPWLGSLHVIHHCYKKTCSDLFKLFNTKKDIFTPSIIIAIITPLIILSFGIFLGKYNVDILIKVFKFTSEFVSIFGLFFYIKNILLGIFIGFLVHFTENPSLDTLVKYILSTALTMYVLIYASLHLFSGCSYEGGDMMYGVGAEMVCDDEYVPFKDQLEKDSKNKAFDSTTLLAANFLHSVFAAYIGGLIFLIKMWKLKITRRFMNRKDFIDDLLKEKK